MSRYNLSSADFYELCETHLAFLMADHGYKLIEKYSYDGVGYRIAFANCTTIIQLTYECRERDILVYLCPNIDGNVLEGFALDKCCISIERLIQIRNPAIKMPAYGMFSITPIKIHVVTLLAIIKTVLTEYASDLHRGDFSAFGK